MHGRDRAATFVIDTLSEPGSTLQIVGPPGIGKSTLARESLASLPSCWVTLEPVSPDGVLVALAHCLGVPAEMPAVLGGLGELELLGLDGAEGLGESIIPLIEAFQTAQPHLRIVVTARQREFPLPTLELGPLDADAARALFLERAQALCGMQLEQLGTDEVDELLARLDGWPLAIELAASRMRLFSPSELLREPAMEVLRDRRRTGRHSSLEGVLETSWSSLAPGDAAALANISPFAEGFDRAAFEQLSGTDLGALERLMDASLVRWTPRDGSRHYQLLAPVREFALGKLADDQARERHADWVLGRAMAAVEAVESEKAGDSRRTLKRWSTDLMSLLEDPSPVRAAHAALALATGALAWGPTEAARGWLHQVSRDGLDTRLRRELDFQEASLHIRHRADHRTMEIVDRWPDDPDFMRVRAIALLQMYDSEAAVEEVDKARALTPPESMPKLDYVRSIIALHTGENQVAVEHLQRALDAIHANQLPDLQGNILRCLSLAYRTLGIHADRRVIQLERAVALHRASGAVRLESMAMGILAVARGDAGLPNAKETCLAALALARRTGEETTRRQMHFLAATIEMDNDDDHDARARLEAHAAMRDEPWTRATLRFLDGILAHRRGETETAVRLFRESAADLTSINHHGSSHLSQCYAAIASRTPPPPERTELPESAPERVGWRIADLTSRAEALPPALVEVANSCSDTRMMVKMATATGVSVSRDGTWFRTDAGRVEIRRKRVLTRVLAAIVNHGPISQTDLLERAWPGEKMTAESGRARVHVAIAELRKLGLRGSLVTVETEDGGSGYVLRGRVM